MITKAGAVLAENGYSPAQHYRQNGRSRAPTVAALFCSVFTSRRLHGGATAKKTTDDVYLRSQQVTQLEVATEATVL
jgi:hypothetical protein